MTPIPSRREAIARARAAGRRVALVLPIHAPRALLRACGFHGVEVWGPPGVDASLGASHFQAYTCAIVRNATSFILAGSADDLDAILVPHTCDALQGMASVLKDFVHTKIPVLTLYLPRGRRDSDLLYLVDELRRLANDLSAVSGTTCKDDDVRAAIEIEVEADAAAAGLLRARDDVALSDRALYQLLRSREYLSAEDFLALVREAPRGPSPSRGVPLLLSGIVPEPMAIFDEINEMGARVVSDDLACVSRRHYPDVDDPDPWRRLARVLLGAAPEPTLGSPIPERVDAVRARVKAAGARGVLVYDPKFCEPELFYLPLLRAGLDEVKVPLLHLEFDMESGRTSALPAQTRTRIEAFVEMLR